MAKAHEISQSLCHLICKIRILEELYQKKKKLIPRNTRPTRLSLELKFLMTTTVQVQGIYILKLAKEKVNEGTGELNRFIKCFLHNRENPSSTPELTLKDRHSKKNVSSQDSGVRDGRISGAH